MTKAEIIAKLNEALALMKAAQVILVSVDSNDDDLEYAIDSVEEEISAVYGLDNY